MAKDFPPYVIATGVLSKVFEKIKEASTPPRFTQDYLVTKLGFAKSGSTLAMIPFLKKLGFLGSDGVPSELYEKFRNPNATIAGVAIAKGMKIAYADLYERNEYFHNLDKSDLKSFLIEVTGAEQGNRSVSSIVNTIEVLKSYASFDFEGAAKKEEQKKDERPNQTVSTPSLNTTQNYRDIGFNISYTINLNLPETSDITVFDAIFKSLKEHILSNEK